MQPTESFSVSRRALDVEDYIDVMRRHRGWIFGPFLLCLVGSVVGAYLWPETYQSQSVVKIVPQQVPENMVQAAVNQVMSDRVNAMAETIMSRTELTTIINSFNLYPKDRTRTVIDDVVETMRKAIRIVPVASVTSESSRAVPAFAIQFSYENKYLAQRVVQDLTTKFMDENVRSRTTATFQTTQFLKDEADRAKKTMDDIEIKLTEFRVQNNGRLPDQVDSNVRQLQALQSSLTYLDTAVTRAQQDKLQMETNLRIYKDQQTALNKEPTDLGPRQFSQQQKSERMADVDREIQALENQISVLRQHYTDSNPDVRTAQGRLAIAKKRRADIVTEEQTQDEEKKEEAKKAGPIKIVNPELVREARDLDAAIRRLESSIQAKDTEIAEAQKESQKVNSSIKIYQARIETIPLGERQYGELIRDRDIARQQYTELDEKLNRAQIAQEMEGRKQGENLELLDPASLPTTASAPKRPLIISSGAGIGLLLGIVIAGAREMKDTSIKNMKDVRAYTQMPILGSVPLLENDFVVRRRRRMAWLGWTTACLAAAVVMAGVVVYYYVNVSAR
jgi:polysaccharide chain length determinant protein (PEP-CTERM system associated)